MAIDPAELAEEQEQRQRINVAGAPTEFAKGPEREGVEVAGLGTLLDLFRSMPTTTKPTVKVDPEAAISPMGRAEVIPQRPPTLAEERAAKELTPDYKYQEVQRAVAPSVLQPPALQEFERRGFQAFPSDDETILQTAQQIAKEEAESAKKTTENVINQAQKVVTKESAGRPINVSDLLAADRTKSVLERLEEIKRDASAVAKTNTFNTDRILTGEDLHLALEVISEDFADAIELQRRGVISNEQTVDEAAQILATNELGFTEELLKRQIGDGSFNAAKTLAARQLLVINMERLLNIKDKIMADVAAGNKPDPNDLLEFRRKLTMQAAIQIQTKGNQTEAARTLQIFNVPVSGEEEALQGAVNAKRLLNEAGGEEVAMELVNRLSEISKSEDAIAGINRFSLKGYAAKGKELIHQAYMAGLLSNPATQVKNILGTASYMLYQIPSELMAGAYGSAIRRTQALRGVDIDPEQVYMRDALLRMKGWSDSFKDAWQAGALAFRTELPSGSRNRYDLEVYNPVGEAEETFFSKSLSYAGKGIRLPFRLLLGADEFFKVMSQRGELYTAVSRRYGDLILQGKSDEEALAEAGMLLLDPKAVSEVLEEKGLYDTMQSDLGALGKLTGPIQNNFFGRFILPFATAPANSMMRVAEHTPLGYYKTFGPKGFGGGATPKERQIAFGRATLGSATMLMFSQYAAEGRITGSRPRDKAAREALPPNWQPYSFVVRDEGFPEGMPLYDMYGNPNGPLKYIPYSGFEPVGAIIGLSADYAQRASELPPSESTLKLLADHAGLGTSVVADYMSELPMLKGISDVADALSGNGLENLLRSYPQSASAAGVPNIFSGLQRAAYDLNDPRLVKPRKDVTYYTEEDVLRTDENGNFLLGSTPSGKPRYDLVGVAKDTTAEKLLSAVHSYFDQDTFFPGKSQYDLNAIVYDTMGNQLTSSELSLANRPVRAIINRVMALRVEPGREPTDVEKILVAIYGETGKWPLKNKESLEGIGLSFGAQSDWTYLAKNPEAETRVAVPSMGYLRLTFQEALELMTTGSANINGAVITDVYTRFNTKTRKEQASLISQLNDTFYDATIEQLFEMKDEDGNLRYENLRTAYQDVQTIKEREAALNR